MGGLDARETEKFRGSWAAPGIRDVNLVVPRHRVRLMRSRLMKFEGEFGQARRALERSDVLETSDV